MRPTIGALLLSLGVLLPASTGGFQPPPLTVLSSNATREVLLALEPQLIRAAQRQVVFRFANSNALKERIEDGEAFDVAVLTAGLVDALSAAGQVAGDSRVDVARAGVGMAVKKGRAVPDIATPAALERALAGAASIAYVEQGATAPIMQRIFDRFGIAKAMQPKTRFVLHAAEAVAAGEAELGFTQTSEIVSVEGVVLAGLLPEALQVYTVFRAGVSARSPQREAAASLIRELGSPAAAVVIREKGMEPVAQALDRLPPIPAERMTPAQRQAAEDFKAARGVEMTGPFHPLLRSPELMTRTRAMGDYLRYKSTLPPRLSEFVILITAREWSQQYEWNAHYAIAMKAGLPASVAQALAEGRRPDAMNGEEEAVYEFCTELLRNKSVSDATYARAIERFTEAGVVDTIGIVGYYSLLAMTLNTARTPLPPGVAPPLAPFPR